MIPIDTINQSFALTDALDPKYHNYSQFAFVRNPWDRMVSNWSMFSTRRRPDWYRKLEFDEYIDLVINAKSYEKLDVPSVRWKVGKDKKEQDYLKLQYERSMINHAVPLTDPFSKLLDPAGAIRVNFVGYFERLQEDFNLFTKEFGLPGHVLPHENISKHKPYWEYYSEESKSKVESLYARDIEMFGYKFRQDITDVPKAILK